MNLGALKLSIILFGLSLMLKFQAWRHPAFRERLKENNLTGQFIARDEEIGRWFRFQDGQVSSGSGVRKDADVTVAFKNAALGAGQQRLYIMPSLKLVVVRQADDRSGGFDDLEFLSLLLRNGR